MLPQRADTNADFASGLVCVEGHTLGVRLSTLSASEDLAFRHLAFQWLHRMSAGGTRPLLREDIEQFKGHVPGADFHLILQQGIWKPAKLMATLSVTTGATDGRRGRNTYTDTFTSDGLVEYDFTSARTKQHENDGLRQAHELQLPMIYFRAIRAGLYDVYYPVYVRRIDEHRRKALLDLSGESAPSGAVDMGARNLPVNIEVRYGESLVKRRLHQRDFRSSVLFAYQTRCAICSLQKSQLLDAAHIRPDRDGGGAEVSNGLALCKIHHSAYDSNILGITPDYRVQVHQSILDEKDGPMLTHGLQGHHDKQLTALPTADKEHPDRDSLAERYEAFKASQSSAV